MAQTLELGIVVIPLTSLHLPKTGDLLEVVLVVSDDPIVGVEFFQAALELGLRFMTFEETRLLARHLAGQHRIEWQSDCCFCFARK